MGKSTLQQGGFLILSLIFLLIVTQYELAVYGNDKASITKYIMTEAGQELQDHVKSLQSRIAARTGL